LIALSEGRIENQGRFPPAHGVAPDCRAGRGLPILRAQGAHYIRTDIAHWSALAKARNIEITG